MTNTKNTSPICTLQEATLNVDTLLEAIVDAQDRLDVQQMLGRIREEKKYQAWKATRNCGIVTLGPDDLILPCVLPTNHGGYCSTGR